MSPDRSFLRSLYLLATALSWAFWASWSISWVWTSSNLWVSFLSLELDWWDVGPRQHEQGIPWYSHGRRWTCWRLSHWEAWSWGFFGTSLVVTRSIRGAYRMGGRLLSCPFLHSKSFNPSGLLRSVLILACCQSVVPSTSLLKEDLGGTCRNQSAWAVAWKLCREWQSWSLTLASTNSARTAGWMARYRKQFWLCKTHCSMKAGFCIQSVLIILLWKGTRVVLPK